MYYIGKGKKGKSMIPMFCSPQLEVPQKCLKIKPKMNIVELLRGHGSKKRYEPSHNSYHAEYLMGNKTKKEAYENPVFYKKIFSHFKKNLRKSDKLIIIGYSGRDEEINRLIKECFDYEHKPIYIIDTQTDTVEMRKFEKEMNAHLHQHSIETLDRSILDRIFKGQ